MNKHKYFLIFKVILYIYSIEADAPHFDGKEDYVRLYMNMF